MTEPKHTPGPWEWTEPFGESRTLTTGSGREPIIQAAAYGQPYLHASEADEALIAAAPDLYAALKALEAVEQAQVDYLHAHDAWQYHGAPGEFDGGRFQEEIDRLVAEAQRLRAAALAKADGGQGPPDQQATPAVEGREDGNE